MSSPSSPSGGQASWQSRLESHCRAAQLRSPEYRDLSDRRGGRTAWSSQVIIPGHPAPIAARYWYDGQYLNNAREDAAEVALQTLRVIPGQGSAPGSPGGGRGQGQALGQVGGGWYGASGRVG